MRIAILIVLISSLFCSCAPSYLDKFKRHNDSFELLNFNKDNLYRSIDKVGRNSDGERSARNNFELRLPKNIIYLVGGTNDIIEYTSKQIIYIIPGYKEEIDKDAKWILRDATDDEVFDYHVVNYYDNRGYSLNKLEKISDNLEKYRRNREYKIYTNGSTVIFLHNIKKKNYEHFLKGVKSFRYIVREKKDSQ